MRREPDFEMSREKFRFKDFFSLIGRVKPRYWQLIVGIILGLLGTGVQLVVPKFAQQLVNQFSSHINYPLIGGIIALFLVSTLVSAVSGSILGFFGEEVVAKIRTKLWDKMLTLPVKYFDTVKSGDLSSRLSNDSTQVKDLLANTFPSAISSILLVTGSVVIMFTMDWRMTLAMFISVPLVALIMIPLTTYGRKIGFMRQNALAEFNGTANESLGEIRLIKSSNAEAQENDKAEDEINKLYGVGRKESVYDAIMSPFMMMVLMILIFGLLAYGIHRIAIGAMTIGTLTSFLMYLLNFMGAVPTLTMLFSQTAKAAGSTTRIQALLDEPTEDLTKGKDVDVEGLPIKVDHLNFEYDKDTPVLTDVSFEAKPNTVVAFAGPSGGGKSTIFSILERFYLPTSGSFTVGDHDVADVSLQSWREQIGFVGQDSPIMAGTIRSNLTYGLEDTFSDDELWHVLSLAFAETFVKEMPDGLDTQVGERGVKVSGGQRQRLAIARAFLRDPKILMLDEATASLDSESEAMVQKALGNLMENRTTFVIAHRLSTIVDSDKIYFVDHGKITGSGTHSELVKTHELYAQYVNEQLIS